MNTGKILSVAQADLIAKEIAPTRTISILEDGRVVARCASDEEYEKLARHGFDDGVSQAMAFGRLKNLLRLKRR